MEKNLKVYICSALYDDDADIREANRRGARRYCREIERRFAGFEAIAPHAFLPLVLNDEVETERRAALLLGRKLLEKCDMVAICGDRISPGMRSEIALAKKKGMPVICTSRKIRKFVGSYRLAIFAEDPILSCAPETVGGYVRKEAAAS